MRTGPVKNCRTKDHPCSDRSQGRAGCANPSHHAPDLSTTTFSIEHDGRSITGRQVLRNHRQVTVQLIQPFGLLSSTLHMPSYMVATSATLLGPSGDERRAHVQRLLYADVQRFHALLPGLLQALPPGVERTIAFMEGMDAHLGQVRTGRPELNALPW